MKKVLGIILVLIIGGGIGFSANVQAQSTSVPDWIKNTAGFWVDGNISDTEFLKAIQFLITNGILTVEEEQVKHETTIEEKSELEIKAERLQKAHNDLVNSFKEKTSNPKDYGFDLDLGWTNDYKKGKWCEIVLRENRIENVFIFELEESLKQLENESNLSLKLQEYVIEDKELLRSSIDNEKLSDKLIIDFDCQ